MHSRVLSALICAAFAILPAIPVGAGGTVPAIGNVELRPGAMPFGGGVVPVAGGDDVRAGAADVRLRLAQDQSGQPPQRAPGPPPPLPPSGPTLPPPGPGLAPAFGTPNVVFVAGIWRIVRSSGEFYLWADNGDRAIQVTLDSNGWWGIRRQSDEKIVWSSGRTGEGKFYERPWLRATGSTYTISSVAYEGRGTQGPTFINVANDQIRITLTDRGEIQLNTRARNIIFRTSRGETVTF